MDGLQFFWWLMVSAVVVGIAITKVFSVLWDFALDALTAAGSRLWAHLTRR